MKFIKEKGTEWCLRRCTLDRIKFLYEKVQENKPFQITGFGVAGGGIAGALIRSNWMIPLGYSYTDNKEFKRRRRGYFYELNPEVDKNIIIQVGKHLIEKGLIK